MKQRGEGRSVRFRIVALSIWLWMACVAIYIAVVIAQAPPERQREPWGLLTLLPNLALLLFAGWVAAGVRRGERLTAAIALLVVYGGMGLIAAGIFFGSGYRYEGSLGLVACMCVLFVAWLNALVMVLRARALRTRHPS